MTSQIIARRCLQTAGLALIALAILHLIATPHIAQLLDALPRGAREFAMGPTMLNHVLVGVLLFPLGFTTWLVSLQANAGTSLAKPVLAMNSVVIVSLPILVAIFMRQAQYYTAPLFIAAVGLTSLLALIVLSAACAVIWSRSER